MPITSEEAVSGALRGVLRALETEPPDGSIEDYASFVGNSLELVSRQQGSVVGIATATAQQGGLTGEQIDESYLRALAMAVTSLLALAHFPYLKHVECALPDERQLS